MQLDPVRHFRNQMITFTVTLKCSKLYFPIFSRVTDVSSGNSQECEIMASCSQSRDCQYTNQMITEVPDSNVTFNCSMKNGGTALGRTWEQVKQSVNARDDLVLKQVNSTSETYSCSCTRIEVLGKHCLFIIGQI